MEAVEDSQHAIELVVNGDRNQMCVRSPVRMTQRPLDSPFVRRFILTTLTITTCLSIGYLGRGVYHLILKKNRPVDLALRWRELRYVVGGQNPYDISEYLYRRKLGLPPGSPNSRPVAIDPQHGATWVASGYPPWAFFWSNLFILPVSWQIARVWFFLMNMVALAVLVLFAWQASPSNVVSHRLLLALAVVSGSPLCSTLVNGQWGVILCAILAVCIAQRAKLGRTIVGVLYAVALLKPTFSFTHSSVFLNRRFFASLVIAFVLTLAASAIVGWHVATSPYRNAPANVPAVFPVERVFLLLLQHSRHVDPGSVSRDPSLFSAACCAQSSCAFVLVRGNKHTAVYELAVCCVLSRLFTYHQSYDDVLIVFLTLALGQLFLKQPTFGHAAMFALLLAIQSLPLRLDDWPVVQYLYLAIWSVGLAWLVYFTRCPSETEPQTGNGEQSSPLKRVFAQGHMRYHLHINFITFYIPFNLVLFALNAHVVTQILSRCDPSPRSGITASGTGPDKLANSAM